MSTSPDDAGKRDGSSVALAAALDRIGEAAEFDPQVPHWFVSTGGGSAEVLSIFGRPDERMHLHDQSDADASGGRH
ncbi:MULTISPECIES: hypothetical protein [unclassified Nocardioides]|uniref:hypothetical protein n=1 Tax=unclassified Nocardioides TaxID=2615069 RepID=UPI0036214CBF